MSPVTNTGNLGANGPLATLPSERRARPRARTSLVATLSDNSGRELPVVILEVSISGVLIESGEALPLEANFALSFAVFGDRYRAGLQVVRAIKHEDAVLYGCRLLLPEFASAQLEQAIRAALGQSHTSVRPWDEIRAEVNGSLSPDRIVVGQTPAGHPIELSSTDCLEMGREGVDLFVQVVGSLEPM